MQTEEARRAAAIEAELSVAASSPFPGLSAPVGGNLGLAGETTDLTGSLLRRGGLPTGLLSGLASGSQEHPRTVSGIGLGTGASQEGAAQTGTNSQGPVGGNLDSTQASATQPAVGNPSSTESEVTQLARTVSDMARAIAQPRVDTPIDSALRSGSLRSSLVDTRGLLKVEDFWGEKHK